MVDFTFRRPGVSGTSHTTAPQNTVANNSAANASPGMARRVLSSIGQMGMSTLRCVGTPVKAVALTAANSYFGQEAARRVAGSLVNASVSAGAQALTLSYSRNPYLLAAAGGVAVSTTKAYVADALGQIGKTCKIPESKTAKAIEFADNLLDAGMYMAAAVVLQLFVKKALLEHNHIDPEGPDASAALLNILAKTPAAIFAMELTKEGIDFIGHRIPIAAAKSFFASAATFPVKAAKNGLRPLAMLTDEAKKSHIDFGLRSGLQTGAVLSSLKLVSLLSKGSLTVAQVGPSNAAATSIIKVGHSYMRSALYNKVVPKKVTPPTEIDLESTRITGNAVVAQEEEQEEFSDAEEHHDVNAQGSNLQQQPINTEINKPGVTEESTPTATNKTAQHPPETTPFAEEHEDAPAKLKDASADLENSANVSSPADESTFVLTEEEAAVLMPHILGGENGESSQTVTATPQPATDKQKTEPAE